jgi:hypothetical protein
MATFLNKPVIHPAQNPLLKRKKSNVTWKRAMIQCADCPRRWPLGLLGVGVLIDAHTRREHPETWAVWKLIREINEIGY